MISEIGVNLSDRMYQGEYNGSKKHEADLPQVLDRAWKAGLESMIITGGSLSDASQAIELSKQDGETVIYYTTKLLDTERISFMSHILLSNCNFLL